MLFSGMTALVELNDLKRIVSAHRVGSIATRLFEDAWAGLESGLSPSEVTWWITGRALAATRLGDLDRVVITKAGVSSAAANDILKTAIDEVVPPFADHLRQPLHDSAGLEVSLGASRRLSFVQQLARQPRAGITCPGKPRIILEPPENHAEHCLMVAVYGVLLAPVYEADPTRVFVAGLSHHLHNAGMPDSGFTGEMLLGRHLESLVAHYTQAALGQLVSPLREQVDDARKILPNADTPDGRAFHAADVLDRVIQTTQYTRAAALTPQQMLGEMELVHEGPVKAFQDDVLRQAGLL
ncbi:HD domain-containing protein [Lichenihabitans sp. PAMC28606]|uniref:HD domain-containing protein n=1 Tax=Lichenihabitans sp. PAMC28606 TaxID=2880932 RepID=UPI0029CAC6DA|nr:HD domain-containing protein [Lichenihabitans sp. PAMC28606]